ncbi:MAG: hypothetical protein Kow0077_21070 [Anaerolineae bacterium]
MATLNRIIAADSSPIVAGIARASADLLARDMVIVAVQSGSAVMAELRRGDTDLVVCGPELNDMTARELVQKIHQRYSSLPVLVLADDASVFDPETLTNGPCYVLARPAHADRFVHTLAALLDGLDPSAQPVNGLAGVALGPVPDVDMAKASDVLSSILTDVGAMAVVLADREGRILQEVGAVGYLNRDRLTATLSPIFSNMVRIGALVGGGKPQAMHFYDGEDFDIFALAIGLHHYMCLIFEGTTGSRAFGAVTMFGRRAIGDLLEAIGNPAFTVQRAVAEEAPAPRKSGRPAKRQTQEIKIEEVEAEPVEDYEPPEPERLEPLPEDADLEAVLAGLENLDPSQMDELFDPDKLAEIAADRLASGRLSFDEAREMGVLDEEE